MSKNFDPIDRRSFITGAGGAAAVLGIGAGEASAHGRGAKRARWQPVLEPQDAWMELPGRHRMVFDCTSVTGTSDGLSFANTYFNTNRKGYDLGASDLAVIIILRHYATVFAYDDRIWQKYGTRFGEFLKFDDPKTKKPPLRNVYVSDDQSYSKDGGGTLAALAKKGVHFAVCGAATEFIAGFLAGDDKAKSDDIHRELVAALIPNAHLAPSGIVALNRTQERGYAIAQIG